MALGPPVRRGEEEEFTCALFRRSSTQIPRLEGRDNAADLSYSESEYSRAILRIVARRGMNPMQPIVVSRFMK